ncbi:antibiotic biosynthesis monooxygenase [Pseudonocardia sp. ICBG162]|uniref:antibiotic biosynthesis monooxygenase family protein n=1 Tax=Pseudonocardia sp. ICBG162 TaxID=2846761 RepID=UPI001CF60EA3|nr:antibiotic biosynthesis monooxygenase [Pseudonocardia sp. ICBG162]
MSAGFRAVIELEMTGTDAVRFVAEWPRMAEEVAEAPGCLEQWLFGPDRDGVVIMSDWVDEDAFHDFEAGPVHAAHRTRIASVRTGGRFRGLRTTAAHQVREGRR